MASPASFINHVLPGETGGDTTWFARQSAFEQAEIQRQVAFRRRQWPHLSNGAWSKRPDHLYPHILPAGNERLAFYPLLAEPILEYLECEDIALHSEALNLKSSQVACFNILFPLHQDLHLATAVWRELMPGLAAVTAIEFEYTGPASATAWLGEPARGRRGQNRTSIDAAVFWQDNDGRRRASLIEWKYTEHNFGVCSAFTNAVRTEQARCLTLDAATAADPARACLLTDGGDGRGRRYWEHLASAGIRREAFAGVAGCPFSGPLYQLLRQQLLAAYLREAGEVDEAEVLALAFDGNTALCVLPPQLQPLRRNAGDTIIDVWNRALCGCPPVRHVTVEALLAAADRAEQLDAGWRTYVRDRYGV
jgi:hypothetical protein